MRIEPNHPNAKVVKMLVDRLVLLCTVMVAYSSEQKACHLLRYFPRRCSRGASVRCPKAQGKMGLASVAGVRGAVTPTSGR
jgi:hypothetical protein